MGVVSERSERSGRCFAISFRGSLRDRTAPRHEESLTDLEEGEKEEGSSDVGSFESGPLSTANQVPYTVQELEDTSDKHGDDGRWSIVAAVLVLDSLAHLDDVHHPL